MKKNLKTEEISIVIVGHVDHGKSTIIGRLLYDTNSLPKGKIELIKENCIKNSKPFEYAFLLDALKDEQAQGITIDLARVFFKTKKRKYLILDAPGHIEFLKNMITGASRAEAALLVIDAAEGIKENSKRHGYMLSLLGIKQIAVLVNKMDLVNFDRRIYNKIVKEYKRFLSNIGINAKYFIPVSGFQGDNIANHSEKMRWYAGKNVLEALDDFEAKKSSEKLPFRMPVQGVYKFTENGDNRRIVAGRVESGKLKVGDEIVFYPSGKRSVVKTIEAFNEPRKRSVSAGYSTGFTLDEQIYVKRGDIAAVKGEKELNVSTRIRANIFWLGKQPFDKSRAYFIKLGTAKVKMGVEKIIKVLNSSTLKSLKKNKIERNEAGECILKTNKPIAFDLSGQTGGINRFVIVDEYNISGGGTIIKSLEDESAPIREEVFIRNYKWVKSEIAREERTKKYNQNPALILITGHKDSGKKPIAKALEKKLFEEGRKVYFLGIGNVLYGVDTDITLRRLEEKINKEDEYIRRLAEISHIMLDAGIILIITAIDIKKKELDLIKTIVDPDQMKVILIGKAGNFDVQYDLQIKSAKNIDKAVNAIEKMMIKNNIIFNSNSKRQV